MAMNVIPSGPADGLPLRLGVDAEIIAAADGQRLAVDRERSRALEHDVDLLVPGVELVVLGPSAPAGNRTSLIPIEFEPSARRILKKAPRNDSIDGSSWLISVYPIAGTYRFPLGAASTSSSPASR